MINQGAIKKILLCYVISYTVLLNSFSQQLAFPSAEGYGKHTVGGRGGSVYEVTTLNPTGTGSLGAAISASGARTIVFRVSGTIQGNFTISNDQLTIAGQTAPGDGICIKGSLNINANDIIIRYIRVRPNPSVGEVDAIGGRGHSNIIIDHVSASWSSDEVFSLYQNTNTTVQWCIISEACAKFVDGSNTGHRFGGIWGNNYGTHHHNLFAHNDSRNPRWASDTKYNDYRNNVIYNWGYNSCYGGEGDFTVNMVANYYKAGPATLPAVKDRIAAPGDGGSWYVSDNYVYGYPSVISNNWLGIDGSEFEKLDAPWSAMFINQQTPEEAFYWVLADAGCTRPNRDTIDRRIINEVRTGTATYGNNGIITYPSDVGGWPSLVSDIAPVDSDHDGMSNSWEKSNGLDTLDASDRNSIGPDGYTMLENYLNSLAGFIPVSVTGVSFNPPADSIEKNRTLQLYPLFSPINATNQVVSWSSSNINVATVSDLGQVKGIEDGTATITATTQDGGYIAECEVVVYSVFVTGVSVDPTDVTLDVGKTKRLVATILPPNATNKKVTWESDDISVATISSTGYIKGISSGSTSIIVRSEDGNHTAVCHVEVQQVNALDSKSTDEAIPIYPNPFTNTINIDFKNIPDINKLEILTITGQVVKEYKSPELNTGNMVLSIDSPGKVFLIRIDTNGYTYTKKIIRN